MFYSAYSQGFRLNTKNSKVREDDTTVPVNSVMYLLHEYTTIIFNFRQVCRKVIAEHTLLFCKEISVIHSTLVCSAKPFLNQQLVTTEAAQVTHDIKIDLSESYLLDIHE